MAYSPRKNQQKLNERGRDRLIKSAVDSGAAVGVMGSVFDVLSKAEMLPKTPIKEEVQQDPALHSRGSSYDFCTYWHKGKSSSRNGI
jgi:hypothetical protein